MSAQLLALAASYVLGAIPFGYIIVKLLHGADVRQAGSGSTGATNVTRKAGIKAGAMTYLLDVAKGAAAVLLMGQVTDGWWWAGGAATMAIVGHMYPVFLRFKGGKGVATGVGAYIVLVPVAVVCTLVVWALVFKASRMVSLASIVATALVPLVWIPMSYVVLGRPEQLAAAMASVGVGCLLIVWAHRANIKRLAAGTENRFDRGGASAGAEPGSGLRGAGSR
jgi:glycerol-3-phosphate acyltransferase PlsY